MTTTDLPDDLLLPEPWSDLRFKSVDDIRGVQHDLAVYGNAKVVPTGDGFYAWVPWTP
jgi:hypothetical protein